MLPWIEIDGARHQSRAAAPRESHLRSTDPRTGPGPRLKTGLLSLKRVLLLAFVGSWGLATASGAAGPAFDCCRVDPGSVAQRVCQDPALSLLDRRLAEVYAAALKKATREVPPTLKEEQRGWVKGRDDCWKSPDIPGCIQDSYVRRIAELQARYRLVAPTGPDRYACEGQPQNELLVFWFATQPKTLWAERGDSVSLMFREASTPTSGQVLYVGRNESVRVLRPGELEVRWGVNAAAMNCQKQP